MYEGVYIEHIRQFGRWLSAEFRMYLSATTKSTNTWGAPWRNTAVFSEHLRMAVGSAKMRLLEKPNR